MEDISPSNILNPDKDGYYMLEAVKMATRADEDGDVPIGACIVYEDKIIARAWNQRELLQDPTAHAEMIALTQASEHIGSWRLHGCTMYVTLEPCSMCAGAMLQARVHALFYGAKDPKAGVINSLFNMFDLPFNHKPYVESGLLAEESSALLKAFFKELRKNK